MSVEKVNAIIDETCTLLAQDITGKFKNRMIYNGDSNNVPNCTVYASGSIQPIGAQSLCSTKVHYDKLQAAYDNYMQTIKIAENLAKRIIEQSTRPLYYHDGKKFVKIIPAQVIQGNCPNL